MSIRCCCPNCMRFGPTQEEDDRRHQEAIDDAVALIHCWAASPEGQATIERHARKLDAVRARLG